MKNFRLNIIFFAALAFWLCPRTAYAELNPVTSSCLTELAEFCEVLEGVNQPGFGGTMKDIGAVCGKLFEKFTRIQECNGNDMPLAINAVSRLIEGDCKGAGTDAGTTVLQYFFAYNDRPADEIETALAVNIPLLPCKSYDVLSVGLLQRLKRYKQDDPDLGPYARVPVLLRACQTSSDLRESGFVLVLFEYFPIQAAIWLEDLLRLESASGNPDKDFLQSLDTYKRRVRRKEGTEDEICNAMQRLAESDKWWLRAASLSLGYTQAIRLDEPIWAKQLNSEEAVVKRLALRLQARKTLMICGHTKFSGK